MNPESQNQWINEALNEILLAIISDESLRNALIFKGARILNLHLGENRQSLDIDSNVAPEFATSTPDYEQQAHYLEKQFPQALRRHFERQNPVRFRLVRVKVNRQPAKGHPRGWNAFFLKIQVQDNLLAGVLGLPTLSVDVASPEIYGPGAVEIMNIGHFPARVYALHRIAGEKLRAYLSSLPAYRRKMSGGDREFRVKDLHDIARILRARPIADMEFWTKAGYEFQLACQSRLVDCRGLDTFMECWTLARERYESDRSLHAVSFTEAELALKNIVELIQKQGVLPLKLTPHAT